jgi:hypothetical protein
MIEPDAEAEAENKKKLGLCQRRGRVRKEAKTKKEL